MTDEKVHVETIFEDLQYSCGADIHCIDASEIDTAFIGKLFIRMNLVCKTMIEIPYYSVGYDSICIYYGGDDDIREEPNEFLICLKCINEKKLPKKKQYRKFTAKQ